MAPKLTAEQIMALLSSGSSFTDLNKKFSDKDLLRALVTNPNLIQGFREQAKVYEDAAGLDTFDPEREYYNSQQFDLENINPIEERWREISAAYPNQWRFVQDYFGRLRAAGNNPATADALIEEQRSRAKDFGLDDATAGALVESLKVDRDRFQQAEVEKDRKRQAENYKGWLKQREDAGLKAGESYQQKVFAEKTGFGELYDLPDPKQTFAALAKKRAEESIAMPVAKELRGTLGKGSKGFKNAEAQAKKLAEMNKKVVADRSQFERAYMMELEKKGKAKSTPYAEALKKVIPSALLKRALG
jgi:hypothetical protein